MFNLFNQLEPTAWLILSLILGISVGSFLNVVIYRIPIMMENQWAEELNLAQNQTPQVQEPFNLLRPRSHCRACQKKLALLDLIPLVSFALNRGRCGYCQTQMSWQYPLIEALTGIVFVTLATLFPPSMLTLAWMGFCATLIALAVIDFNTFLLPDQLTLPLLWAGLLFHLLFGELPLEQAVLGAASGYLILWFVFQLFKLLTQKEGMGYGDFKLLAAIGAWLGINNVLSVLFIAAFIGLAFGLTHQYLKKATVHAPFPFGPSLVIAAFVHVFGFNSFSLLLTP